MSKTKEIKEVLLTVSSDHDFIYFKGQVFFSFLSAAVHNDPWLEFECPGFIPPWCAMHGPLHVQYAPRSSWRTLIIWSK